MDTIFASKFGIPEVTRELDITYHKIDNDPLSESSHELTSFYDAVNPVDDKHPQRLNDIDVLNSVKDPDLKNAMMVALTKQSDGTEIDTSGMTDDEIAETALPQNVTYGQLYDALQDVAELQSIHSDVTNPTADAANSATAPTASAPTASAPTSTD